MQMAITFMAVVAGLIFSVAVALLAEELIFGQVFRLIFGQQPVRQPVGQVAPQTAPVKIGQRR
jgi:ABC-type enterobactin transport system permease subunit